MLTCLTANLAILHIFVSLKDQIKTKSLSLFPVKNYSLQKKKKKKLGRSLQCKLWIRSAFDIIAITESRIKNNSICLTNVALHNYSIEQTPTETSASGVLLYMNQILLYKPRTDLKFIW